MLSLVNEPLKKNRVSKSEDDRETRGMFRISTTEVYEEYSAPVVQNQNRNLLRAFKEQLHRALKSGYRKPASNTSCIDTLVNRVFKRMPGSLRFSGPGGGRNSIQIFATE